MDSIDQEFGPIRKSAQKVESGKIIQDVGTDHEQQSILKKIKLIPKQLSSKGNERALKSVLPSRKVEECKNERADKPQFESLGDTSVELKENVKREYVPETLDTTTPIDHTEQDNKGKQRILNDISLITNYTTIQKNVNSSPTDTRVENADNLEDRVMDSEQLRKLKRMRLITKSVREDVSFDKQRSNGITKSNHDVQFEEFKEYLLRQLNNTLPPKNTKFPGFIMDAYDEVERILKQSVIQKESHSAILVAPRSYYKTAMINHHLALLSGKYNQQFVTIRLNGLIHTEQAAINSIATQLETQLQQLNNDKESGKDTSIEISSGSLTEVFEKILKVLDSSAINMKHAETHAFSSSRAGKVSVIFIFDEIDTFAGPVRQTLLYNLFDMVEHARVPVCILGCTTKLNILEFLEKRVRSRFSQRIIVVPQAKSLKEFTCAFKTLLKVEMDNAAAFNWNKKIDALLDNDRSVLSTLVKTNFETFRDIVRLKNSMTLLVSKEQSEGTLLTALDACTMMTAYNVNQLQSSLTAKVKSLSDLELLILLAAARVSLKNEDQVNFNLAYEEYSKMIKAINSKMPTLPPSIKGGITIENTIRIWNKKDIKNVWENIVELNFLSEKGAVGLRVSAQAAFQASNYHTTGTTIPFDLRMYQLQITLQELRRALPSSSMYHSWTQL